MAGGYVTKCVPTGVHLTKYLSLDYNFVILSNMVLLNIESQHTNEDATPGDLEGGGSVISLLVLW